MYSAVVLVILIPLKACPCPMGSAMGSCYPELDFNNDNNNVIPPANLRTSEICRLPDLKYNLRTSEISLPVALPVRSVQTR